MQVTPSLLTTNGRLSLAMTARKLVAKAGVVRGKANPSLRKIAKDFVASSTGALCAAFAVLLVLYPPSSNGQDQPNSSTSAQKITEYGKPEEVKAVTRVFVFTGADMYSRDQIIKEIEKKQKKGAMASLKIVEHAEDAEILINFSEKGESYPAQVVTTSNPGSSTSAGPIIYGYSRTGIGFVLKPVPNEKGMRLLMNFTGEKWR